MLLAGWAKQPAIKQDQFLAYAYTIAVSKLEGMLGKEMQVKANSDMSAALRKAAHTMLSMARDVLSNPLKTPTSAVALFHAGGNLLADWDLFHLRPSEQGIVPIAIANVGGRRTKRPV